MYFRLSGEINTNWRYGQLSVANLMNNPEQKPEKFEEFFKRQAVVMMANLKNEGLGELGKYEGIEVELQELRPVNNLKLEKNGIQETDKLIFEYVHLPLVDVRYNFLYRFIKPLPTIWSLDSLDSVVRDIEEVSVEGGLTTPRQFMKHCSLNELLNEPSYVVSKFDQLLHSGVAPQDLPHELAWMQNIKDFEVHECKLEEVGESEKTDKSTDN